MINKALTATFTVSMMVSSVSYGIDFTYLNGTATDGYTVNGAPTNLIDRSAEMPVDVLSNIYSMLPESQYVNSAFVDTNLSSNLVADADLDGYMTVEVTFLNEGAGYRNTFGFFTYDASNPPATIEEIGSHVIIFPNASKPAEGELTQGDTVDLNIQLTAGQALGFFVVPNGWGWSGSYGNVESLGPWGQPFYSLPHLNPEPEGLKNHNVVFYDTANQLFVIGFDDQHRTSGDNDFNDILFSISATPFYAVEGVNEDGSVDANSYQVLEQSNTEITSTSYYPSQNDNATLMFEDLWPVVGDYDFNDLVVSYQYKHTLNNQNDLIALEINYSVQAIGASFNNGLALHLPGVPASNVATARLEKDGVEISQDILDPENNEATILLLADARQQVDYSCGKFRTELSCDEVVANTFKAIIAFENPVDTSVMGAAPYDPYIFAVPNRYHGRWGGRSWEVHLKQFPGSDIFNNSLIGIEDDASTSGNYFINSNAFPWALNIPASWVHPQEKVDIMKAYPMFKDWVTSSGSQNSDWYTRENANPDKIYERQ